MKVNLGLSFLLSLLLCLPLFLPLPLIFFVGSGSAIPDTPSCTVSTGSGLVPDGCPTNCGPSALNGVWSPEGGGAQDPLTYTQDLLYSGELEFNLTLEIAEIRCNRDEYMPTICRIEIDICNVSETEDVYFGSVNWTYTDIGTRRFARCQYAYPTEYVYASRDCLVAGVNATPTWSDTPNMKDCPLPPFSRELASFCNNVADGIITLNNSQSCSSYLGSMTTLIDIRQSRPSDPFFETDLWNLVGACVLWADSCLLSGVVNMTSSDNILWNASDILLDPNFQYYWNATSFNQFVRYVLWLFPDRSYPFRYNGSYLSGLATGAVQVPAEGYSKWLGFTTTPTIAAKITIPAQQETILGIYALLVQSAEPVAPRIITSNAITSKVSNLSAAPTPSPSLPGVGPLLTNTTPMLNISVAPSSSNFLRANDSWSLPGPSTTPNYSLGSQWQGSNTRVVQNTVTMRTTMANYLFMFRGSQVVGPLLYVNVTKGGAQNNNSGAGVDGAENGGSGGGRAGSAGSGTGWAGRTYGGSGTGSDMWTFAISHPDYKLITQQTAVIITSTIDDIIKNVWIVGSCVISSIVNGTVCGYCTQPGYIIVYAQIIQNEDGGGASPMMAGGVTKSIQADLSVFLGFAYNRQLYIAGQVLRALSLVCLVVTILSYTIFRNTRQGMPTRILLNLCVSLVVLYIVLYVAEASAGAMIGCRVSNVFRYYLVFVSLLWNAVEAHNMYRMLIKVFDADHTSHFVCKAAVFAWGLPAIAVGISLAVSVNAFDGSYTADCAFRCNLGDAMLRYGWLVPMSIIIVHNIIVFGLVVNVICKMNKTQNIRAGSAGTPGSQGSSNWTRLVGALTMLALLGVPWMFSAFGVINSSGQNNEMLQLVDVIFNAIFIVCVSLQGVFIFTFHCARLQAVRERWKASIFSLSWVAGYTSSSSSSPPHSSTNLKLHSTSITNQSPPVGARNRISKVPLYFECEKSEENKATSLS